jgi:hypothetical protein
MNRKNVYDNVHVLLKSFINGLIPPYNMSKLNIKKLSKCSSDKVIELINEYEVDRLLNISSCYSSSSDNKTVRITCSIIWQIESDKTDDGIQQMIVDFVIQITIVSDDEMNVKIYEKLPTIHEIGLYDVNDRAIGIKDPRDLLTFV